MTIHLCWLSVGLLSFCLPLAQQVSAMSTRQGLDKGQWFTQSLKLNKWNCDYKKMAENCLQMAGGQKSYNINSVIVCMTLTLLYVLPTELTTSSIWLQMPWCWNCTRPSATTTLTQLWQECLIYYIVGANHDALLVGQICTGIHHSMSALGHCCHASQMHE